MFGSNNVNVITKFLSKIGTHCKTKGGKECVFPFRFRGKTYRGCLPDPEYKGETWCSTKVYSNGTHVGGEGKYGLCSSDCPKHRGRDAIKVFK